jgi:hypothetical protein
MTSREEFRDAFPGKRRDYNFWDEPRADEIRELLVRINRMTGDNLLKISRRVGFSESTVSLAAGGRAGRKSMRVMVERLGEIVNCQKGED